MSLLPKNTIPIILKFLGFEIGVPSTRTAEGAKEAEENAVEESALVIGRGR